MGSIDRIDVTGERPYPGAGRARCPRPAARDRRWSSARPPRCSCTSPPSPTAAEEVRAALAAAGIDAHRVEIPDAEDGKSPRGRRLLLGGVRAGRAHPLGRRHLPRRGSGHRPRRVRGRDLDARGAGRARADHAARDGRRGRRREDRHQHRGGQEPRRGVLRAVRGARRPRHARHPAARRARRGQRGDHQDRVHRRPDDPRPRRGRSRSPRWTPPGRCCPSWCGARSG